MWLMEFLYDVALEAFESIIKGAIESMIKSVATSQNAANEAKKRKQKE